MMQGQELQAIQQANPLRRIIFCGDGANDLCPALWLGPQDFVLARKGHPLEQLILKRDAERGAPAMLAHVRVWQDHADLADIIQALCAPVSC